MMKTLDLTIREASDSSFKIWARKEKSALELLKIAGELRFEAAIDLIIFRNAVYDSRPSEVLNFLGISNNYAKEEITIETTLAIAHAIQNYKGLKPSKIDIGKMAVEFGVDSNLDKVPNFVNGKLDQLFVEDNEELKSKDVVLYGFGRIGRLLARIILKQTGAGQQLRLKAIVIRPKMKDLYAEAVKRASLLQTDSIHGDFGGYVRVKEDGSELYINGNIIKLIYAKSPEDVDYLQYGIKDAILIDNTGVWRDGEALKIHKRPGIERIMLTAPGALMKNIVFGVNHLDLGRDDIFCAASCTTNAIVPVLKTVDDAFGIEKGHIETIHAYTSDQNLLDNFHKKPRRGKAAALNMVLTTTGAAKAVSKVLPHLEGILTGNAVRVPTPNVSIAILNLNLNNKTDKASLNKLLKDASYNGALAEQMHFSHSEEFTSTSVLGSTATTIIDGPSTIVSKDGKSVTIYAWYDNEYGYSHQVIRLAKHAANVRRTLYL